MSSTITLQAFGLSALESIAKIVASRYTSSEMTELFRKAGFPELRHDGGTKWRWAYTALEELQNRPYGPYQVAKLIQQLCDPQEFFSQPEYHAEIVQQVNEILAFYKLDVDQNTGNIKVSPNAEAQLKTRQGEDEHAFDLRVQHPQVLMYGRSLYIQGRHFQAVFECCRAFNKFVQRQACLDRSGSELMSAALSLNGPLKLNSQRTETERNEQEGVMHLCMGLMRAIRNPEAHEPELDWPLSKEDALDVLGLLSFLYRRVAKATYYTGPQS